MERETRNWSLIFLYMVAPILVNSGHFTFQEQYGHRLYGKAVNLGQQLKAAYNEALCEFDVLVMPTLPNIARKLPEKDIDLKGKCIILILESLYVFSLPRLTCIPNLSTSASFGS